jgi:hypothetical protein
VDHVSTMARYSIKPNTRHYGRPAEISEVVYGTSRKEENGEMTGSAAQMKNPRLISTS